MSKAKRQQKIHWHHDLLKPRHARVACGKKDVEFYTLEHRVPQVTCKPCKRAAKKFFRMLNGLDI